MLRQELTREEKDRLAERLLPGESILWAGKSRIGLFEKVREEWPGLLFLIFFATAFGRGACIMASGPQAGFPPGVFLVGAGLCCLSALLVLMMVLAEAIMKSLRIRATLHALTDRRLFSVGPGSGGGGTRFLQFNGEELRKIRIVLNRDGTGDLIFRYQFPLRGKPVPEGWLSLSEVEEVYKQVKRAFPHAAASRLP